MNGQPIPGFYYDTEKKKYFRIQNPGAAQGLNVKYTTENIRKEQRNERLQQNAVTRLNQSRKGRVVKRYAGHLIQNLIEKEIGFRRRSFYVQNAWPDACVAGIGDRPQEIFGSEKGASIRYFDQDPTSKTIYAVHGENRIKRRRRRSKHDPLYLQLDPEHNQIFEPSYINSKNWEPWDELTRTTSTVSSLNYLPASGALAVTTYGSDRPPVVYLSDPDRDGPYVGQLFTPKGCNGIWGAAARPLSFMPSQGLTNSIAAASSENLAVGASNSLLLFTRSSTGSWDSTTAMPSLDSDILSLDWISYTTIALGCRDGKIHLYDTRSGGSSRILRHPYPISKIRRADDETRLICSGIQDSLCLYDIRSPRSSRIPPNQDARFSGNFQHNGRHSNTASSSNRSSKKRRKLNQSAWNKSSQPVLSFLHHNQDDLELDIDIHPRFGLLAAAQEPATGTAIRISNIWTGKTVKEIKYSKGETSKGQEASRKSRCVKFMDCDEPGGDLTLWTCWNGGIAEFAW